MGVLHSFSINNIFYDKTDVRLFLFSCDKLLEKAIVNFFARFHLLLHIFQGNLLRKACYFTRKMTSSQIILGISFKMFQNASGQLLLLFYQKLHEKIAYMKL